jgi:DUF4097 and DUF4098 domain-containing protein YvlB
MTVGEDTMTVREGTRTVEHSLGTNGSLEIRLPDASIRLRGVDGDVVRGRINAEGDADRVRIDASAGRLTITSQDQWHAFGIGLGLSILGFGSDSSVDIELEVPRTARVVAEIASGDIRGEGLVGRQRYRSASGEIELTGAAGTVEVDAVSGGLRLSGPGPVKVRARTVSGEAEVATGRIEALNVSTTSGDVQVHGALEANGEHRISTVSGDVELTIDGGARIDASTVSGDIASDVPHRSEGGRGRRSLILGDGAATLYFKSVSGDLRVRSSGRRAERVDILRPREVAPDEHVPVRREKPLPPNMDRIAILEGVERGEISVAEASRWLALLDDHE